MLLSIQMGLILRQTFAEAMRVSSGDSAWARLFCSDQVGATVRLYVECKDATVHVCFPLEVADFYLSSQSIDNFNQLFRYLHWLYSRSLLFSTPHSFNSHNFT